MARAATTLSIAFALLSLALVGCNAQKLMVAALMDAGCVNLKVNTTPIVTAENACTLSTASSPPSYFLVNSTGYYAYGCNAGCSVCVFTGTAQQGACVSIPLAGIYAIAAEVSNSSFYLHGAANDVNCNALTGVYNSTNGSCVAADNGWHAVVIGMNAPLVAHRAFVGLECNNPGQFCANATNGIFYCNYVTYAMFDQCFEFDNSSAYVSNTTATRAPTPTPTPTPTQTRTPAPTTGANPTTATGSTVTTGSLTTTSAATQVSVSALLGLIVAMLALAH